MSVAPDLVTPADDLALGVEIGLDLDRHRRAERRVRHLIGARPLHAHRPALDGSRQQDRVERDIVGAIMPIAAGALDVLHGDVLDRHSQYQRKVGAQEIDALTVGPDMDALAVP
jgi:hypothetical protein